MRDLALTAFVFGMLPVALRHTWVGCLLYMWISIMNPHRLTWGFAYDFPFAMIVGIVVLLSLVLSVDRKRFPVNSLTIVLLCLAAWMNVTQVFALEFELDGRSFVALNGGPDFQFNEAISIQVECADQAEVDRYWDALTADGGQPGPCGWLKDKFGLSWQIIPKALTRLMADPDPAKARRVTAAMLKMSKIDVAALEAAHRG